MKPTLGILLSIAVFTVPAAVKAAGIADSDNATTPDSINQLVSSLSATQGLWVNGRFVPVHLPVTISPEQVVQQIFQKTDFYQSSRVTDYKILATRQVSIDRGRYTAALVQTNLGKMIVLFTAGGQWNRAHFTKPSA